MAEGREGGEAEKGTQKQVEKEVEKKREKEAEKKVEKKVEKEAEKKREKEAEKKGEKEAEKKGEKEAESKKEKSRDTNNARGDNVAREKNQVLVQQLERPDVCGKMDTSLRQIDGNKLDRPDVTNQSDIRNEKIPQGQQEIESQKDRLTSENKKLEIDSSDKKDSVDENKQKLTETDKHPGNKADKHDDARDSLSKFEQEERQSMAVIDKGVSTIAFPYDKHDLGPEQEDKIAENVNDVLDALKNPDTYLYIEGRASAPGSEEYNKEKSELRAESVKDRYVEGGVDEDRIRTYGRGELIQALPTEKDDAYQRVAIIEIRSELPEKVEDPGDKYKKLESLDDDIKYGEKISIPIVQEELEKIQEDHHLTEKMFFDNPSDDTEVFAKQVKEISKETITAVSEAFSGDPEDLAKLAGKLTLDGLRDFLDGVRIKEMAKARDEAFKVRREAMAAAVFNDYKPEISNYTPEQSADFKRVFSKLNQLSDREKHQVKTFFIAGKTFQIGGFGAFDSRTRFEQHFNVSNFKKSVDNYFNKSKYRYR